MDRRRKRGTTGRSGEGTANAACAATVFVRGLYLPRQQRRAHGLRALEVRPALVCPRGSRRVASCAVTHAPLKPGLTNAAFVVWRGRLASPLLRSAPGGASSTTSIPVPPAPATTTEAPVALSWGTRRWERRGIVAWFGHSCTGGGLYTVRKSRPGSRLFRSTNGRPMRYVSSMAWRGPSERKIMSTDARSA